MRGEDDLLQILRLQDCPKPHTRSSSSQLPIPHPTHYI